jgi:ParB family chromosome partitioning protein
MTVSERPVAAGGRILELPVGHILPDPTQPRKYFDPEKGERLAESMAASGLAVAILVRPVAGDRYMLVHGERRWRAATALGWETIAAEVRELDAEAARWLALCENLQRADLTPIEEAEAFRAELGRGLTQEQLGRRLGKTQS